MSDIEIAQAAKMRPIIGLCGEKFAIDPLDLEPYGHYKAKLSLSKVRAAHPTRRLPRDTRRFHTPLALR
jgi:formyltetrahydrofolate synthetase